MRENGGVKEADVSVRLACLVSESQLVARKLERLGMDLRVAFNNDDSPSRWQNLDENVDGAVACTP